ncbi:Ig-like domain-containing protein, partial [Enterobacter kobei]|uniref:Ig-like domain-containing protein n=1 Tax=Enterobacter kobei TaxID=208224 RepID=UPI0032AEBBD1
TVNTDASGVAVAEVKDTVAEVVTVGATAAGVGTTPASVDVTFIGVPDAAKSTLAVTTDSALSDGVAANTVTATFLDASGVPVANVPVTFTVSGTTAQLTAATVNTDASGVAVAEVKDTVAEVVTVGATAAGVGTTPASVDVTFTLGETKLSVNGATFAIDSGVPSTGFTNAKFQIQMYGTNASNGNYDWSANQEWVSVDSSGNVIFTSEPTSETKTVTITASPKNGQEPFTFSFTIGKWFLPDDNNSGMTWTQANSACSTSGGLSNNASASSGPGKRLFGSLWGEWGDMEAYGFNVSKSYWLSTSNGSDYHYRLNALTGGVGWSSNATSGYALCLKSI